MTDEPKCLRGDCICYVCVNRNKRLVAAEAILEELTAYNVGIAFINEERIQPLWENWIVAKEVSG